MAIQTTTTWSADDHDYHNGTYTHASLERFSGMSDSAELIVDDKRILLDADRLLELSQAAGLIAAEIKDSK